MYWQKYIEFDWRTAMKKNGNYIESDSSFFSRFDCKYEKGQMKRILGTFIYNSSPYNFSLSRQKTENFASCLKRQDSTGIILLKLVAADAEEYHPFLKSGQFLISSFNT